MQQKCEIILDSMVNGERVITMRYEIWRPLHAELMTYRQCARNASSSRAIPFMSVLERVRNDAFIPNFVGKEHKGMMPDEYVVGAEYARFYEWCSNLAKIVSDECEKIHDELSVAKSILNRYLEPFNTINVLMTGSIDHWIHLFSQRLPQVECREEMKTLVYSGKTGGAEPNLSELVVQMMMLIGDSDPVEREQHLPYLTPEEDSEIMYNKAMISAARCARLSYTPFGEPKANKEKDLELGERLLNAGHMSPFEHQLFTKKNISGVCNFNAISPFVCTFRQFFENDISISLEESEETSVQPDSETN